MLGIDTSCYTTSVAVVGEPGLLNDRRLLLEVPPGKRGLRQAEAVFQHVRNLPQLLSDVLPFRGITAVAVSGTPRSLPDSYMPVFKAGEASARSLALAWDVPCHVTSHQAGHIWAGLYGRDLHWEGDFWALHISGGTTELVSITLGQAAQDMAISLMGGSLDIHAGQLIDRIGVQMGLTFPAGPHLEKLAMEGRHQGVSPVILPISVRDLDLNLSGPEAAATRALEAGADPRAVAQGVEECLAQSLAALIKNATANRGGDRVLIVGGVAANKYIRNFLESSLSKYNITVVFAPRTLSGDNAVGVAAYGLRKVGAYRS